jgi:flagellar biogenesis protein FliO
VQLTLGVTPQHISALHTQPVSASSTPAAAGVATPSYQAVAQAIKRDARGAGQ